MGAYTEPEIYDRIDGLWPIGLGAGSWAFLLLFFLAPGWMGGGLGFVLLGVSGAVVCALAALPLGLWRLVRGPNQLAGALGFAMGLTTLLALAGLYYLFELF